MKHLLKKAKAITILILMLSLIGCENDDTNLPKVIAGFTYTLNADTGTVTFINTSENAGSYTWDYGDGGTSKEINPVKTYANGTYTVVLKASNASGASATFEDTIIISIPNPITLPVTFDDPNVAYEVATFGGTSFEIIDNPDVSGTNDQATKVGAITNSGATDEGINFDLGTQLDLAAKKTITMNFWADAPVDVLLKLEQGTGDDIEVTASHGGTGWEMISFDFNSSDKYVRITIFVDGPGTTAGTFYIDDIMQIETPPAPCIPETTQSLNAADFNLTFETDPTASIIDDGAVMTSVANPDSENDINSSCKVGKVTRDPNSQYANNQIEFATKLDFDANSGFKLKVWSPQAGTNVLVKLEDKTNREINVEIGATTSSAGAWEELTFNFASDQSGRYDKIVLFFNIETNTPGEFYIDDFRLYERAGGGTTCTDTNLVLPIDFDCDGIDYGSKDTGDVDFEVIDNPELSGINATPSKVAKLVFDANQPWENMNLNLDTPISFATDKSVKLKLFSSTARAVLVKFEMGTAFVQNEQNHTGSGWEELTFTFDSADEYSRLVLFVDGGSDTTGTFYVDDIEQIASTPPVASGLIFDFENNLTDITVEAFESAGRLISNPVSGGINTSSNVYEVTYTSSNQWWGGVGFKIGDNILDDQARVYRVKLYSTVAPINVLFQVEVGGTNEPVGDVQTINTANEWVEVTFTIAGVPSGINRVLIRPDVGDQEGTKPNGGTLYVDDIACMSCTLGTGTPPPSDCPAPPAGELLSNGDFEAGESCWQFIENGGIVEVTDTQSNGGTYSAKLVAEPMGATSAPVLKQEGFAIGSVNPGNVVTVSFDIKAFLVEPGAVVKVALFSEQTSGAVRHDIPLPSFNNTWQSVSIDITTAGTLDVTRGLSIEFQADCGGNNGCKIEMYVDNVSVKLK